MFPVCLVHVQNGTARILKLSNSNRLKQLSAPSATRINSPGPLPFALYLVSHDPGAKAYISYPSLLDLTTGRP